ncbi:hypothetical protein LEP1GSC005_2566 [Leptospira santarosai str. ST188]|nr:hypothetical protein LEP1GSC005_2566 [Leptospira santarosai str. ST188]
MKDRFRCSCASNSRFLKSELQTRKQKPRSRSLILKEPSLRSGYLASTVARCRDEIQNHFFPIQLFGTKQKQDPDL